jgi:hypothetical protein
MPGERVAQYSRHPQPSPYLTRNRDSKKSSSCVHCDEASPRDRLGLTMWLRTSADFHQIAKRLPPLRVVLNDRVLSSPTCCAQAATVTLTDKYSPIA